jgi:hypothetical protein
MTYPFLSSFIKESLDGSFFSFVLGLFSSLPNPPSLTHRKSGYGATWHGCSCTTSSVWKCFQRSLWCFFGRRRKKEPSAKRGIPLLFLRKAGAKVHRLFHTTKSFCKFFQKIMKKEQKNGEKGLSTARKGLSAMGKGLSAMGKGLPTTGKGLSTRRKGLSLQGKGRLTQNETFEKR